MHGTQLHIGTDMIHMVHIANVIGTDIDKAAPLRVSEMAILSNKLNCAHLPIYDIYDWRKTRLCTL